MKLDYRVVYSKRKTIALIVERDRSLVVRAPTGTPEAKVRQAVEAKKLWLYEKTNHARKYPLTRSRKEFVSGETITYLGRNYRLELVQQDIPDVVFKSRFMISRNNRRRAAKLFRDWYIARAHERLTARARHFSRALGVQFRNVLVSELRVRWGSCTPSNNLNFNWRIMKAPLAVIDYLVVHELAHFLEPNHTARFWNIIAVQVPYYEQAKEWLRQNGNLLEVDF